MNIIATKANKIDIKIVSFIVLLYHKKKELHRRIKRLPNLYKRLVLSLY